MRKSLPVGWQLTNGILAIRTYFTVSTTIPGGREEHGLHLKLGLMFKVIHNLCYYPDIPSFHDNIHRRAAHAFQFELPFAHTNA